MGGPEGDDGQVGAGGGDASEVACGVIPVTAERGEITKDESASSDAP